MSGEKLEAEQPSLEPYLELHLSGGIFPCTIGSS